MLLRESFFDLIDLFRPWMFGMIRDCYKDLEAKLRTEATAVVETYDGPNLNYLWLLVHAKLYLILWSEYQYDSHHLPFVRALLQTCHNSTYTA